MADKLISANAVKDMMFNYYPCVNKHTNKRNFNGDTLMAYEVAELIDDCIENAPAVDAVQVVRCGMLAAHTEAVYVRLENGVETFIPLDSLEWYNVKEDGANNAVD